MSEIFGARYRIGEALAEVQGGVGGQRGRLRAGHGVRLGGEVQCRGLGQRLGGRSRVYARLTPAATTATQRGG